MHRIKEKAKKKSLSVTTVTSSEAQDLKQMIDLDSNSSNIQLEDSNPNINSLPTESRPYISRKIESKQSELGVSQGQNLLANVDMWSEHPTRSSINSISHLSGPQHSNPSHTYQHSSDSTVTQYPGFYYPL